MCPPPLRPGRDKDSPHSSTEASYLSLSALLDLQGFSSSQAAQKMYRDASKDKPPHAGRDPATRPPTSHATAICARVAPVGRGQPSLHKNPQKSTTRNDELSTNQKQETTCCPTNQHRETTSCSSINTEKRPAVDQSTPRTTTVINTKKRPAVHQSTPRTNSCTPINTEKRSDVHQSTPGT